LKYEHILLHGISINNIITNLQKLFSFTSTHLNYLYLILALQVLFILTLSIIQLMLKNQATLVNLLVPLYLSLPSMDLVYLLQLLHNHQCLINIVPFLLLFSLIPTFFLLIFRRFFQLFTRLSFMLFLKFFHLLVNLNLV